MQKQKIGLLLLGLMSAALFSVQFPQNCAADISPQSTSVKIAFVYKTDLAGATSFQSLLNTNGFPADLINCASITSTTFASYSLVIIGPDAATNAGSVNSTITSAINGSIAKILGIGVGGSYYLGAMTSTIGYPHTMGQSNVRTTNFTACFVANYHTPYPIPAGNTTLFTSPVYAVLNYNSTAYPASVHVLGERVKAGYHDIVQYTDRYVMWGFNASSSLFTDTASKAFIDIINAHSSRKVAFVYKADLVGATAFQSLLNSKNATTELVKCSSITSTTFITYSLVIIGPDSATSPGSDNSTITSAINGSGAKILGIGAGGSYYLGALTSTIGYPHTMGQPNVMTTNFTAYFNANFHTPYSIPAGNTTLFTSPVFVFLNYNSTAYPASVHVLGDRSKTGYHDIVQYADRYVMWGFNASASLFTDVASKAFINIVKNFIPDIHQLNRRIAFVYKTNLAVATSFQTLLSSNGSTVDLVSCSSITSSTFENYSLVIIGPDAATSTGTVNSTITSAINGSSAKILGIGVGGSYYLGAMTSTIGSPHTMGQSNVRTTNFTTYFTANFHTPYPIPAGYTTLFTSPVYAVLNYNSTAYPASVHVLGDRTITGYHDIVQYADRYVMWGFNASASLFTDAASKAFINIVKKYIPDIAPSVPRNLQAIAGNNQISLAWQAPLDNGGAAITAYKVYRGTAAGSESLIATIGNVNTYIDTTATNGIAYYYRISAVNSVGEGASSNEASATASATSNPGGTIPGYPIMLIAFVSVLALILIPMCRRKQMHI